MKGVILAAGTSSRLRPLTDSVPKCLLDPGSGVILGMALENLAFAGIRDVVIVTGYRGGQIRRFVENAFPALSIEFVENDRFETTNNIYSLFLALRAAGGGEILLLDSDIVFDRRIIPLLTGSVHESCLAMSRKDVLGDEEIKVQAAPGGAVLRIGKDVPPRDAAGESIGIERLGGAFLRALRGILEDMMPGEGNARLFYEAAFQRAIDRGLVMAAVDVGALQSIEIDTPGDLLEAGRVSASLRESYRAAALPPA